MTTKQQVLIVGMLAPRVMDALESTYETYRYWEAEDKDGLVKSIADRVTGIATTGHYGASADLIAALPELKIISCYGVGVDAIDLDAAQKHSVTVTNTPGVLTDDVANLAVAFVLMTSRDLVYGDGFVRDGSWEREGQMHLTRSILGKKAGIIGLGRIGLDIGRKLEAFGMDISWTGPRPKPDAPYPYFASAAEMAAQCDYVIVACPGGPDTHHIVNDEVLRALGPQGTLINISRGSCVDEPSLIKCLDEGALGWAGLDVFEDEPRVPSALRDNPRVTLQPHAGSATEETRQAMGDLVVENLALYYAGSPVRTPIV